MRVAEPAGFPCRSHIDRGGVEQRREHPLQLAQLRSIELSDRGMEDARASLERPRGQRAPGRLEPHQRPAAVRGI